MDLHLPFYSAKKKQTVMFAIKNAITFLFSSISSIWCKNTTIEFLYHKSLLLVRMLARLTLFFFFYGEWEKSCCFLNIKCNSYNDMRSDVNVLLPVSLLISHLFLTFLSLTLSFSSYFSHTDLLLLNKSVAI